MESEWTKSTWGDEVSLEYGKGIRGYQTAKGRYRVFGANGPVGWTSKPLVQGSGVILGRKGAYRGVEYSKEPFFVIDTAYYVQPKKPLDMRWLYYAIKYYRLGEIDDGSPIPSTTRAAVYVRDLSVPPLPEQKAIAHVLGSLDDKIEANRQMNSTLEAMAQALFKSWFVDFDPVRENMARKAGRSRQRPLPGLAAPLEAAGAAAPEGVLDLFPDEFEDSELGPIPRGWRVSRIGDVAQIFSGKRPLSRFAESSPEASVPLWGGNGPMAFVPSSLTEFPVLLTGRVGTLGSVFRVKPPSWPSDNTLILRPHRMRDFEYLFHWLQQIDFDVLNRGSTQPLIAQSDLKSEPVLEPSEPVLSCFGDVAKAIYRRVDAAVDESTDLSAVRDALLPKLISGELRVSDTEAISREAS